MRCLVLAAISLALPAWWFAAPCRADALADWQAVEAFAKELTPLREKDPKAALEACKRFAQEHPNTDPWVDVLVSRWQIDLFMGPLNDSKAAMAICDAVLDKYPTHPVAAAAIGPKTRLLLLDKQQKEAMALVDRHWGLMPVTHRDYSTYCLAQYCIAAEELGKHDKIVSTLVKAFTASPLLLDESKQIPEGWMYDRLVKSLTVLDRLDEALAWGKMRFMACKFDTAAIERSTRMLSRVWMIREFSGKAAAEFAQAQKDLKAPNPLAGVKLPAIDPQELAVATVGTGDTPDDLFRMRITVRMLQGDFQQAVLDARQLLLSDAQPALGTGEICRVLKAADCSVKRANDFIAFVKTGEGANPLDEFLQPPPGKE